MQNDLNQRYIMSRFNPCSASLMGGAMDSRVKIIKKTLKSIVRDYLPINFCQYFPRK